MLTYDVEMVDLEPQPSAVVRGHVRVEEIPEFLGRAFGAVMQTVSEQHLAPAGPPFGCFVMAGDGFDVDAGFPVNGPVAASGDVVASELPGGPAARVLHKGDYGTVSAAYETVSEWVEAHEYVATGPPWECYLDGPEVPEPRTLVYLPCTPA